MPSLLEKLSISSPEISVCKTIESLEPSNGDRK